MGLLQIKTLKACTFCIGLGVLYTLFFENGKALVCYLHKGVQHNVHYVSYEFQQPNSYASQGLLNNSKTIL